MGPPIPSYSSIEESLESMWLSFSSSSSERRERNEPKTEFRPGFCSVFGLVFGLSGFSNFSDPAESSSGLVGASDNEFVEMDGGLRFLLLTSNFSEAWAPLLVLEWPKMLRLLRRRWSDIASLVDRVCATKPRVLRCIYKVAGQVFILS